MAIVRIVLAADRPLLADALCRQLASHDDLRIEAQVPDELAAALAVRQLLLRPEVSADDPVVVITLVAGDGAIAGVSSHLISEFPEVLVVTVSPDSGKIRSHRGSIQVKDLHGSLDNLVQELRSLLTDRDSGKGSA